MSTQPDAAGGWTVDFWFDPSCPLTRHTAGWVRLVADHVPLRLRWRVMSLSVLNEHRDDDPEDDPEGYLWIPARVAAAVQTEHGHAALGAFYEALWEQPGGDDWIGDLTDALRRADLPVELAGAGTSSDYDDALRASHHAGVDRVHGDIGTPVLSVTAPDGRERTFFGPVLASVPGTDEALRLWEALVLLVDVPTLREIKA